LYEEVSNLLGMYSYIKDKVNIKPFIIIDDTNKIEKTNKVIKKSSKKLSRKISKKISKKSSRKSSKKLSRKSSKKSSRK
jgi:hypothetical protein